MCDYYQLVRKQRSLVCNFPGRSRTGCLSASSAAVCPAPSSPPTTDSWSEETCSARLAGLEAFSSQLLVPGKHVSSLPLVSTHFTRLKEKSDRGMRIGANHPPIMIRYDHGQGGNLDYHNCPSLCPVTGAGDYCLSRVRSSWCDENALRALLFCISKTRGWAGQSSTISRLGHAPEGRLRPRITVVPPEDLFYAPRAIQLVL